MHARRQEGSVSTCGVWHNRRTGSGSAVSRAQKQCPHSATRGQGAPIRVCRAKVCTVRCVCVGLVVVAYLWHREHHQVQSAVLLNVVVCKSVSILKLMIPAEDEALLLGGEALFELDLRLHVLDSVIGGNLKGDCPFSSRGLDEDPHPLYKVCGVHLPSKKTNSLVGGRQGECRDACSQAGRERLHMWCVAQPTDRVRVCCVSSTEAVSTQCHTRSGCSHQGVQSKSVQSSLCVGGHTCGGGESTTKCTVLSF